MNLDDLVLLRGWINHLEWTELDSQIPEAGASSRKKIKDQFPANFIPSKLYLRLGCIFGV